MCRAKRNRNSAETSPKKNAKTSGRTSVGKTDSVNHAWFRFYAELNDHLPPEERYQNLEKRFFVPASVKDMIESFGVPHAEVDLVLINGEPAEFSRTVADGDRVSVYPVFEAFDIAGVSPLRVEPLREPKFVLDVHLGRLAAYLRMLGFDTLYTMPPKMRDWRASPRSNCAFC
jgi:hypothetical protein